MVWVSLLRCLPEKKRKETESPAGKDASDSFFENELQRIFRDKDRTGNGERIYR